jgi:hypothetical protein
MGLLSVSDPPRPDTKRTIQAATHLVRTVHLGAEFEVEI